MKSMHGIVYLGALVVVASVALRVAAELTRRIVRLVPYVGGLSQLLNGGDSPWRSLYYSTRSRMKPTMMRSCSSLDLP